MALIEKYAGKAPNKGLIAKYAGSKPKKKGRVMKPAVAQAVLGLLIVIANYVGNKLKKKG